MNRTLPYGRAHPCASTIVHVPPGVTSPRVWQPGDFILCRATTTKGRDGATTTLGQAIQSGERTRFGSESDYARWTHSAGVVSRSGDLMEAIESGVKRTHVEKYKDSDYVHVSPVATATQRQLCVAFWEAHEGVEYDVLDFGGLVAQSLFGGDLSVHRGSLFICSGLVARGTEKYIASYGRAPECMMPADLAYYWRVQSEEPLPAPGWFGSSLDRLATVTRFIVKL